MEDPPLQSEQLKPTKYLAMNLCMPAAKINCRVKIEIKLNWH